MLFNCIIFFHISKITFELVSLNLNLWICISELQSNLWTRIFELETLNSNLWTRIFKFTSPNSYFRTCISELVSLNSKLWTRISVLVFSNSLLRTCISELVSQNLYVQTHISELIFKSNAPSSVRYFIVNNWQIDAFKLCNFFFFQMGVILRGDILRVEEVRWSSSFYSKKSSLKHWLNVHIIFGLSLFYCFSDSTKQAMAAGLSYGWQFW